MPKKLSSSNEPVYRKGKATMTFVKIGINAFRNTWLNRILTGDTPLARAVRT